MLHSVVSATCDVTCRKVSTLKHRLRRIDDPKIDHRVDLDRDVVAGVITSCGGTSIVIVRRLTFTILSTNGIRRMSPGRSHRHRD